MQSFLWVEQREEVASDAEGHRSARAFAKSLVTAVVPEVHERGQHVWPPPPQGTTA
jgi:hypothetical protein